MSSIQMNSEELYKKCCVYMLWTDIVFRYAQAETIVRMTKRKSWFKLKEYSYQNAYDYIQERTDFMSQFPWFNHNVAYTKGRNKVWNLMLLCKNGNPVTVTTEDSFVLNLNYTKELANLGITPEKAVEICEVDDRVFE